MIVNKHVTNAGKVYRGACLSLVGFNVHETGERIMAKISVNNFIFHAPSWENLANSVGISEPECRAELAAAKSKLKGFSENKNGKTSVSDQQEAQELYDMLVGLDYPAGKRGRSGNGRPGILDEWRNAFDDAGITA